jgi:hypothetical protein
MTMASKTPSPFSDEVLDQILANYTKPEDLTGKDGILKQLTARLVERALQSEMSEYLGYEKHDPKGRRTPNPERDQPQDSQDRPGRGGHRGPPGPRGELRAPAGQEAPERGEQGRDLVHRLPEVARSLPRNLLAEHPAPCVDRAAKEHVQDTRENR